MPGEGEYFEGRIDEVRIYDRALGEGEVEPNQGPDVAPPEITLSGPLTEGLKKGTKEYALEIHAVDGTLERRGSGVKNITIAVDGEVADSLSQKCPETNCGLQYVWSFDQEKYGFKPHSILVSVEDYAGNIASEPLLLPVANGSFPACSATETPVETPPDEVEELPGGGQNAIYLTSQGETVEFPSPPPNFDPTGASDEDLDLYGFPPRPPVGEPERREEWEQTVGTETTVVKPGACMSVNTSPFLEASAGASKAPVSLQSHFAGWLTSDPSGPKGEWRGASAEFRQPELKATCPGKKAALVSWVGITGPSEAFFQAGTNAPYEIGPGYHAAAFTEFFRAGHGARSLLEDEEPMFTNLKIKRNDSIFAEVLWKPGAEEMIMYVKNMRSGEAVHLRMRKKGQENVFFDGRSVQYLIERPVGFELQNFGSIAFKKASGFVGGEGWKTLGALKHRQRVQMQDTKKGQAVGRLMASTSGIYGKGKNFNMSWHACDP